MNSKTIVVPCRGVDCDGKDVLENPIQVPLSLHGKPLSNMISVDAGDCPYNCGSRGLFCKAAFGKEAFPFEDVVCRFSFEYPYVIQRGEEHWKCPQSLKEALREMHGS